MVIYFIVIKKKKKNNGILCSEYIYPIVYTSTYLLRVSRRALIPLHQSQAFLYLFNFKIVITNRPIFFFFFVKLSDRI